MRTLPTKYYLDHFNEFIAYIEQYCLDLLTDVHVDFIKKVHALEHDTLCMLVRVINRRGAILDRYKLKYEEINDNQGQIDHLVNAKFLRPLNQADYAKWLDTLSKVQLTNCLTKQLNMSFPASYTKPQLIKLALENPQLESVITSSLALSFRVKCFTETWHYLLFLYFGELSSGLDKFSMRDMGVLKTRDNKGELTARFTQRVDALDAFIYAQKLQASKSEPIQQPDIILWAKRAVLPPRGEIAQRFADALFYELGKRLLKDDVESALGFFSQSQLSKAREKYLREKYKLGAKEEVKQDLERILHESKDAKLCAFAEDFYQRKYQQAKVSKLTQLLRESTQQIWLDEIFRDSPEKGVKAYYQQRNMVAIRTENRLFTSLFGLFFWTELFQKDEQAIACEFDRRPASVRENRIYATLGPLLESKLPLLNEPQKALSYLAKVAAQYYGQPNGMFRWHSKLLAILSQFLFAAPPAAVIAQLRAMAKDYAQYKDGYPDIMIIDNGQLRFEEVKAQGDVIRPNQLVTMKALQQAGFDVAICRVNWAVDPQQAYVVIDVETTGGKTGGHRITEIGAVKVVDGEVVDSWSSLVNPQRHIPKFITQLTGISNDMVADAPLFCEVVDELECFMQGAIFVAHNVNFDYGFFKLEYERLARPFSMPKMCTVREMRKHFPGKASYSLGKLCRELDIELTNHHRALADARAAAELLIMINQAKQQAFESLTE
ncbi:exonuclease domain-containing protein [Flavobacterium sp. W21_SRS_FM6]|uniref:exonuclease domain-containing protein n=1 Tax=Flavobacterium sp. W21_SRS_FM6 TaxID=3240268 RepID=UPI003F93B68E